MKWEALENLNKGDALVVSYKGFRPCIFKSLKGSQAFIQMDKGDGKGWRLCKVLAVSLYKANDPRVVNSVVGKNLVGTESVPQGLLKTLKTEARKPFAEAEKAEPKAKAENAEPKAEKPKASKEELILACVKAGYTPEQIKEVLAL